MKSFLSHFRTFYGILSFILIVHIMVFTFHFTQRIQLENDQPRLKVTFSKTKKIKTKTILKKQIVQSENSPPDQERNKSKKFLSDRDRVFDRETAAQNSGRFKSKNRQTSQSLAKKNLSLSDLGNEPFEKMAPSQIQTQTTRKGDQSTLSSTNDYLEEVSLGDFTRLNTVKFKHYGFYHRIRQKLEQFWGKSIQEKSHILYNSGRSLASEDHMTALKVTLNDSGEIIHVEIVSPSGIKELDDAAVESFNQAGPFPNPPRDLIRDDKVVLEWGFVVKS